jgi:sugar phosphate isomerase/epimerase
MKIGLYTDAVRDLEFEAMLELAVELGIETLEIGTGGQSAAPHLQLDRLLEDGEARRSWLGEIEERGLTLESLNCSSFPLHPRRGPQDQELIRRTIRLAELVGVDTIVTQSGCPGDSDEAQVPNWLIYPWTEERLAVLEWQWERAVALWRELGRFAADHGVVRICLELHPVNLVYNVPTLLRLREAVGPAIGANFDPSHLMWQGMDVPACVRALGPAVLHVHAKDTRVDPHGVALAGLLDTVSARSIGDRPWAFRTVGYGHGELWWRGLADALRLVGYDGSLSIEHEDELLPGALGVRKGVELLRRVI